MRANLLRVLGLVGALCVAPAAQAQSQGFQLNHYEPTTAGSWAFSVEHPWYSSLRWFAAGLTLDYGHNPLALSTTSGGTATVLLAHQLLGHVDLAGSFLDRFLVSLSLPVTLLERGDSTDAASLGVPLVSTAAVGDPRIGLMARLYGNPYQEAISVSLGTYLWVPINGSHTFPPQEGESGVRVMPKLVLSGFSHHVLWSASAAYYHRPDASLGTLPAGAVGNTIGDEFQVGGAVAYADFERRFSVGPELLSYSAVPGHGGGTSSADLEVLLGANYNIARVVQMGAAAGPGFLSGPGAPDARVLFRLAYAPMPEPKKPILDRDGDGVLDSEDQCIDVPAGAHPDPARPGCPLRDRDGDGVFDNEDQCINIPAGPRPDPQRLGCPLRDTDNDGVFDDEDQCIDVPAGTHPDAKRLGCPLTDTDDDGVFDNEDQCVEVPAGPHPDAKRPGCPDVDSDKDGVYDSVDECKEVPAGMHPDPARPGCPLPDRDQDGVPDAEDACPDKAGAPSTDPKKNGCPGIVEIKDGRIAILEEIFFARDKDVILKQSFAVLRAVADVLKAQPQLKKLEVEGHTDSQGKPEHNLELSERRAQSVLRFLVKEGVEEGRLQAHGYGDTRPIDDNKTAKGRAKNRRVDFRILAP